MEHEPEGQTQQAMTLADGLRLARRYWIGIIAFVAIATGLAYGWYLLQPKVYAADSSGIVVTGGAENLGLSLAGDNLAKAKVKSYKSVGESLLVAERVAKDLGLGGSPAGIASGVSVTVPPDTAELRVSVSSTDPALAQRIADAWVVALAAQVREIEQANSTTSAEPAVRVVPLAKATLPGAPISPNLKLALGVGAGGGLLLGLGYALLRGYLDRRIRSTEDVERTTGLPVVGTLPVDARLADGTQILEAPGADGKGSHAMGEALRELRTNLQFIDVDNPPRILLMTSSVPAEGKSTVLGNLAVAMASAGESVVVVDADLRRPTVHDVFDVVPGVGVTDVLSGRASVEDVIQTYAGLPNLKILGAGRIPPNPSELLGSRAMQGLLKTLAEDAIVLIDAPPLLPVTDAAVLSRSAHGTLVVARVGKTTTDSLDRAVGNLRRVRGKVLGVILNGVATKGPESYTYGYYGMYSEKKRGRKMFSRTSRPAPRNQTRKRHTEAPVQHALAPSAYAPEFEQPGRHFEPEVQGYASEPAYYEAAPQDYGQAQPFVAEPEDHVAEPEYAVAEPEGFDAPAEPQPSETQPSEPELRLPEAEHYAPEPEQYEPEAEHYAPEAGQYAPEAEHYAPEAGQYAPEAEHYAPEAEQYASEAAESAPEPEQYESEAEQQEAEPEEYGPGPYGPEPYEPEPYEPEGDTIQTPTVVPAARQTQAPEPVHPRPVISAVPSGLAGSPRPLREEPAAEAEEDSEAIWLPAQLRGRRSAG